MKHIAIIRRFSLILALITPLLFSCDSPVGFTKAQPEHQPDLTSFPEKFRGSFICDQDSILIKVEEDIIYSEYTEIALIPMKYIQEREDCKIVNDSIYIEGKEECVKIEHIQDGIVSAVKITLDTLFNITPYKKARMHKGNLILSQMTESGLWTIGLLELDQNKGITYKSIIEDSDLDNIQSITKMTEVSPSSNRYPQYKITPKKVELDALFNDPTIFIDCNYYARVHIVQ